MKLSEIKGVDAIDAIADIIDPITAIMADDEIRKMMTVVPRPSELTMAKTILKRKKKEILEILAVMHGENPDTFKPSLIELPIMLLSLINEVQANEELMSLFRSQHQMISNVSFGAVTGNTEETEIM